jgi:hypothetical protein
MEMEMEMEMDKFISPLPMGKHACGQTPKLNMSVMTTTAVE